MKMDLFRETTHISHEMGSEESTYILVQLLLRLQIWRMLSATFTKVGCRTKGGVDVDRSYLVVHPT